MKMKFLTFFALFMALVTLNAQSINVPKSFKATFIQQVKNTKGKVIKYRGRVFFNYPSQTKWIYTSPTRKEVCSYKRQLIVIDHDLEQVSYYKINKGFNLARVLATAKKYRDRTYVTRYGGKQYTIVLRANGQLEQVAYKDNLDNTVNIIFSTIKYRNKLLPNSKFDCIRPVKYDTIY